MENPSQMLPVSQLDWLDPEFNHSIAVSVSTPLMSLLLVLYHTVSYYSVLYYP